MNYVSLFSGIGGFELGIQKAFPNAKCLGYSEICPNAIKVYKSHFLNHPSLGDVTKVDWTQFNNVDLLVGGFPCTDLSIAKPNRAGLAGTQSKLFYEALKAIRTLKPKYFIIENVSSMSDKNSELISKEIGCNPVEINSSLVSAQNRKRKYWCNFPVSQPIDKKIKLIDVLDQDISGLELSNKAISYMNRVGKNGKNHWDYGYQSDTDDDKSKCLVANLCRGVPYNVIIDKRKNEIIRSFSVSECEKLQTFPVGFTSVIAKTNALKALGNAVTVDVIYHICKELEKEL